MVSVWTRNILYTMRIYMFMLKDFQKWISQEVESTFTYYVGVAELVDARDLKSRVLWTCGFDSRLRYQLHLAVNLEEYLCSKS